MDKMGAFNITSMLLGVGLVGLFMAVITGIVLMNQNNYDTTGYNQADIQKYNKLENLTQMLDSAKSDIDTVTVDTNWYDFFSGIWSKIITPFKVVYQSYVTFELILTQSAATFKLMPAFTEFAVTAVVILVIIGIVMIKFHLGRDS